MSHDGGRPRRPARFAFGLSFTSVGTALVLTTIFLDFYSPLPFTAFALSAIAITGKLSCSIAFELLKGELSWR
jgi:hypothetical protein